MSNPDPQVEHLTETLQRERFANVRSALERELAHRGTPATRAAQLAADTVNAALQSFGTDGEPAFIYRGRTMRGHDAVREIATDLRSRETMADDAARVAELTEKKRRTGNYPTTF